ncbi:MAG: hypothetical protein N2C14_03315 [Planctomycetales bacterium]
MGATRSEPIATTILRFVLRVLLAAVVCWAIWFSWFRDRGNPFAGTPLAGASLDAAYFPMAVGDRWIYDSDQGDVVFQVVGKKPINGTECFALQRTFLGEDVNYYVQVRRDGAYLHQVGDQRVLPPFRQFAFPSRGQDAWNWRGSIGDIPNEFDSMNRGLQPVRVPLGTWQAFRVRQTAATASDFWLVRGVGVARLTGIMEDPRNPSEDLQFDWRLKQSTRRPSVSP